MNSHKYKRTKQAKSWFRRLISALGILAGTVILLTMVAFVATNLWPNVGAKVVDFARGLLGDKAVSGIENLVLSSEDHLKQVEYHVIRTTPSAPWQTIFPLSSYPEDTPSSDITDNLPTPTPIPVGWQPENVPAFGTTPGEGDWTPYLWDATGKVVAYRTFLVPDPERPYASVAVVAFDLRATRLHFVLGYDEPKSSVFISRPARIPAIDMVPGKILAAFNGGFKAQHGHFGVMLDGITLITPRDGFGTVAIYDDGKVILGAWGKDISLSPHLVAWRQNGPLIIQDGQMNPLTAKSDPQDWGYTTDGCTATGRSALGISPDGNVLFYAVGFDLTLPTLTRAVLDVGAYQAIQLDINNFYTHFEAFTLGDNGKLTVVPLLEQMKGPGDHRYLTINSRDFFYVTAR